MMIRRSGRARQGTLYVPVGTGYDEQSGIWENGVLKKPISGGENADAASDMPSPSPLVSSPRPSVANSSSNRESAAQRLRDLDALFKDGVINENDFEIKKQELLKSM